MSNLSSSLSELGRGLSRAFREARHGAARRPLLPLVSLGTLSVCLLLVGLVGLFAWNVGRLSSSWSGGGHMTVYLEDDTSPVRATQLTEAVRHLPGVAAARLVDPKEAHARLRGALGTRGEILDGVEDSFLPSSIEVQLMPGVGAMLRAHPAFARLSNAAGVEEVDLHAESTERLFAARALVLRGALALALFVALATLYLVGTSIRLGVEARRDELAVLRLVGATESFVRAPFLVEGAMMGLVGAIVASAATWGIYQALAPHIAAGLGEWLSAAPLSFFPASIIALGVIGGALLGLLGAGVAFSREARA